MIFILPWKTVCNMMLFMIFSLWLRTGSNPPDINRFRIDTGNDYCRNMILRVHGEVGASMEIVNVCVLVVVILDREQEQGQSKCSNKKG